LLRLKNPNKEKLTELVYAAEEAIFHREQELTGSDDHHAERLELKAACEGLMSIQVNKLGWPSVIQDSTGPNGQTIQALLEMSGNPSSFLPQIECKPFDILATILLD